MENITTVTFTEEGLIAVRESITRHIRLVESADVPAYRDEKERKLNALKKSLDAVESSLKDLKFELARLPF